MSDLRETTDEGITAPQATLDACIGFACAILDTLSAHVALMDSKGDILAVNEAWNQFAAANESGLSAAEGAFVGKNYLHVCESATGECSKAAREMAQGIRRVLTGVMPTFEYEYTCHAPHEKRWFVGRVTRLEFQGRLYLVVAHENITSRKLSESALQETEERYQEEGYQAAQAIHDLNVRLHRVMVETHHRVKNNLQIISALIDLERMNRPGSGMDAELARLGTRVMAMAGVHSILTQSSRQDGVADHLSARAVLETLLANIAALIGVRSLTVSLDDIALSLQQGTSLALITNELVLNALKHGYSEVEVTFRVAGNACSLTVCDDGPGFPPDFTPDLNADIGLELINGLVQMDLNGEIHYANRPDKPGAEVTVTFPI